ncbi:MAG: GTP 3',8-cyclase MoaA [Myxococcota bacterium]|nr:GTP 3',8-cyclase MoaA [Myxococcota bacterium]
MAESEKSPSASTRAVDPHGGRAHRKLRLSVTDRCALRCTYCVPDEPPQWLPRSRLLSFEEIARFVAHAAVPMGLTRVRLTGGEPQQRKGLVELVAMLRAIPGLDSLALTTNAERLAPVADDLQKAGISDLNVSLDTLRPERFHALTGLDRLPRVLAGIDRAASAPFRTRKLNCVPLRGVNEDELVDLVRFGAERGFEVRFIEYMPFGSQWRRHRAVDVGQILASVEASYGTVESLGTVAGETAHRYRTSDGTEFGVIRTLSQPFCGHCDRVRLTADGRLLPCLFATDGPSVRTLLRSMTSPKELQDAVTRALGAKGPGFLVKMRSGLDGDAPQPSRDMRGLGG